MSEDQAKKSKRLRTENLRNLVSSVRNGTFHYEGRPPKKSLDWSSYDEAQVHELADILELIRDFVDEASARIPTSLLEHRNGRPPSYPPADVAKALLLQSYFGVSNRVAAGLVRVFKEKLRISNEFSYKTIERGYDPSPVTVILQEVFKLTNELGNVKERTFSSDGSGDPSSMKVNYESVRSEERRNNENHEQHHATKHDFQYTESIVGVHTKMIAGFLSTSGHSTGELSLFPGAMSQTHANCPQMETVLGENYPRGCDKVRSAPTPFSPLLTNAYLNEFDQHWFEQYGNLSEYQRRQQRLKHGQANCVLFRYADDFILSAKGTMEQVKSLMDCTAQFFADKLKLKLSKDKTRVVSIDEGFKFLGFQVSRECINGYYRCVRIRPTQENVVRLKCNLQMRLGKEAEQDDPRIKLAELNRVLRGWAFYYWKVNSYRQFQALDYYAKQLFLRWYCRRQKVNITKALFEIQRNGRITIEREGHSVQIFRMSDLPSQHAALNREEVWRYRHVKNPYLEGRLTTTTNAETEPNDPMNEAEAAAYIHPIDKAYGEVDLQNRIRAFRRDGWRCRKCGNKSKQLVAHHVTPIPRKGRYDVYALHSVDNLQTMCADCHRHLLLKKKHD